MDERHLLAPLALERLGPLLGQVDLQDVCAGLRLLDAGGADDGRPAPPADQSRYAKQVDDACRSLQDKIDALPQPTDAASLETFTTRSSPARVS